MGYKLRNGAALTRDPNYVSSHRDPHSKSSLCILHSRPSIQCTNIYPSLETLNPMHQYISFTRYPYYATLLCPFVQSLYSYSHILIYTPHTYTIHHFYYYLLNHHHHTIYLITTNMYESLPMYIFTPPTYFSFSFFSSFLLPFYLSFLFSFV